MTFVGSSEIAISINSRHESKTSLPRYPTNRSQICLVVAKRNVRQAAIWFYWFSETRTLHLYSPWPRSCFTFEEKLFNHSNEVSKHRYSATSTRLLSGEVSTVARWGQTTFRSFAFSLHLERHLAAAFISLRQFWQLNEQRVCFSFIRIHWLLKSVYFLKHCARKSSLL